MTNLLSPGRFSLCLPRFTPSINKIRVGDLVSLSQCFPTRSLTRIRSNSMSQPQPTSEAEAANSQNDSAKGENSEDVLVQYVVLRRDLIDTWPLGSVVTQGCHASVSAIWGNKEDPYTVEYCSPEHIDCMHKVTLEVKGEAQMLNLSEKLKAGGIDHKLWIEQPENIPTCLATKPYPKSIVALFFKKLKLCNNPYAYFITHSEGMHQLISACQTRETLITDPLDQIQQSFWQANQLLY